MSKRSSTISSLFSASTPSDDLQSFSPVARIGAGSVSAVRASFSQIEHENDQLRKQLESGSLVQELNPDLVEPSPMADRFENDDTESFEILKTSIRERGQEVPILVREHPTKSGLYQTAYGHRRVRAARELAIPVKAIVKAMSDEDLTISQGVENSARKDLSFIERAIFALRIVERGFDRSVIQQALAVDRAEASKLISVAKEIPAQIVQAIGSAPSIGRPRWLKFAELLKAAPDASDSLAKLFESADFKKLNSNSKFSAVFALLTNNPAKATQDLIVSKGGAALATIENSKRGLKLNFNPQLSSQFTDYLREQIPELFARWQEISGIDANK